MNSVFKWSDEQEKAIGHTTEKDGSAIVSAAAGSGKTAMLVERITRMLISENPRVPADKIVAVTFTNDAAGELKSRLEDAIGKIIKESEIINKKGEGDLSWLNEQLINLENANICTISSFCIQLLRENAEELNLKPDFKICEEKESEWYSRRTLEYALNSIYDTDVFNKNEKAALRNMTGEAGDSKLGKAILELHKEYIKQPFPEKWLAEKILLYENNGFCDLLDTTKKKIKNDGLRCLEYIDECRGLSYSEAMRERTEQDRAFAESWIAADLSKGEKGLYDYGNSNYGNPSGDNKALKEQIKKRRDAYVPIFKDMIINAGLVLDFDYIISKQAGQVKALGRLFEVYNNKFRELKKEVDCVDFSDAEHYVLELLQNEELAQTIRNNFHEIIVDEFQDSNAVQYEIFKGLSKNGKNLFFVGDVKQSIYRFRNADQRVFVRVTADEGFNTLTLNKNYRSSKEVTDAVNDIFQTVMTKESGGVDYDDGSKLVFGTDISGGDMYKAELVIIETGKTDEKERVDEKKAEADYIADRIEQMVKSGFKVTEKDKSIRPCNYSDFAVLVSGLSTVEEEFSTAFEERGIPYDKQKSGDYSEVPEIKTLLALLTVIERPFESMELLQVLMSPLYNFTANDIACIRKEDVNKTLFENLSARGNSIKAGEFLDDWRRWSAYSKNNGASRLIRLIYDEGGFNPLSAASANPEKTMTNIRLLLHYSESLKRLTKDTLSGLVGVVSGQTDGGIILEEARYSGESGQGGVKLMTIHASKGLEFPVCFVARTNTRFNLRENYADIIFSDRIGFAIRHIIPETMTRYDTLLHKKAREENKNAAVSEEMRKLYVACTRARDKLILTAVRRNEKTTTDSYLNWLLKTNIKREIIENFTQTAERSDTENVENEKIRKDSLRAGSDTSCSLKDAADIKEAIGKPYLREPLTAIPRRVTATQIGVKNLESHDILFKINDEIEERINDEPTIFPRGASFMENRKLTGKKRGDAYHKMMELIDFKDSDILGQINAHKNRLTADEFAAIEPEKIKAFFGCRLGRRAAASLRIHKEFKLCIEISLSELGYPAEYDKRFEERPFVQGIADMFFYEEGGIILVDYKTNKNQTREKLNEQYGKQLEIYARAIEEMTGDRVKEKWIYSFELGEIML
ncbi:MAG: UvrD-helicase domain-containing protein [Oscillospiraceae bacterium]|nr:UvrD-helicase domain-containing protein [Oscillospiraceae bacterium]